MVLLPLLTMSAGGGDLFLEWFGSGSPAMFELSQQGRLPRKPLSEQELAGCLLLAGSTMS